MKPISNADVKRKGLGGAVAVIGFLLSPLSWWNDLVVNVPLALVFAWCVSFFYPAGFTASFIVGYWLTNIVGLMLMHWGTAAVISKRPARYGVKHAARDFGIALVYTGLIVVLVKLKILGPLPSSFSAPGH
jgi:hypothetical protein